MAPNQTRQGLRCQVYAFGSRCLSALNDIREIDDVRTNKRHTMRAIHGIAAAGYQGENDHRTGSDDYKQIGIADDFERQLDDARGQTQDPEQVENVRTDDIADRDVGLVAVRRYG